MPYEVLVDGATILKSLGSQTLPDGTEVHEHVSTVFPAGAIIADEDVSPVVLKALEDGEEHITSLLKETGDEPTAVTSEKVLTTEEDLEAEAEPGNVADRVSKRRTEIIEAQSAPKVEEEGAAAEADEAEEDAEEAKPRGRKAAASK